MPLTFKVGSLELSDWEFQTPNLTGQQRVSRVTDTSNVFNHELTEGT